MEVLMSVLEFYRTASFIVIGGLVFVILLVVVLSYLYHKDIKGSDFPEWFSLAFFVISFLDFATDAVFFGDLYLQGSSFALYTALFSFVPHVLSFMICIVSIVRWLYCMDPRPTNIAWIQSHYVFLIVASLFSCFLGGVEFATSKLFHMRLLNMQIMEDHKDVIELLHLIINLCFGQFPLLVIQASYIYLMQFQQISTGAISMAFTFTSILIGMLVIVPKLCNHFIDALGFGANDNNNDAEAPVDAAARLPPPQRQQLEPVYILMTITCTEFKFFTHHLYAHKLVASAWDTTLQLLAVTPCDIKCVFITQQGCAETELKFKIRFQRRIYDESLDLHLSMLQTSQAGLEHDILREQISQSLVLKHDGLEINVYRANKFSVQPLEAQQQQQQQAGGAPVLPRKPTELLNEERKWKCDHCTFENYFLLERCEVCHAEKPETSQQQSEPAAVAAAAAPASVDSKRKALVQPPQAMINDATYIELQHKPNSDHDDVVYSHEQKMLLQSIERDNKELAARPAPAGDGGNNMWTGDLAMPAPAGEGGNVWTGDLVIDEDNDGGGRHKQRQSVKGVIRVGSDEEDDDVVLQGISNSFENINTAGNDDDEDGQNGNGDHLVVVPLPAEQDDDDSKQELEPFDDMNELFDNRYTNDGLNDDFDDLAQPDVFG